MAKMTIKHTVSFDMTSIVDPELIGGAMTEMLRQFDEAIENEVQMDAKSLAIATRVKELVAEDKLEDAIAFMIKQSFIEYVENGLKGITANGNGYQTDRFSPVAMKRV